MRRFTAISQQKQRIFLEVAKMALDGTLLYEADRLPFLVAGPEPRHGCCIYHERAMIAEKIRLTMGLPKQGRDELQRLSSAVREAISLETLSEPLIIVLETACDACPTEHYYITNACRSCRAHACLSACPKEAVVVLGSQAHIDHSKCIECGRCAEACPYHAIIEVNRPCVRACPVGAILSHRDRKAIIDYRKCVYCGACVNSCPFGAIVDKTQILQVLQLIKQPEPVWAAVAPSFVGQFGVKVSWGQLVAGLKRLGFAGVMEVALGADQVTRQEAAEFLETVPKERTWQSNSCCPSILALVQRHFPHFRGHLSQTPSPMVVTGQMIKDREPQARVVFIGPCLAKKWEAGQSEAIDAVLTFEELAAVLTAATIDLSSLPAEEGELSSSRTGRLYARTGGITEAVLSHIKWSAPDQEVRLERVEGLDEAVKLLREAKPEDLQGKFVEIMACAGGCVGGPGVILREKIATKLVNDYANQAKAKQPD